MALRLILEQGWYWRDAWEHAVRMYYKVSTSYMHWMGDEWVGGVIRSVGSGHEVGSGGT